MQEINIITKRIEGNYIKEISNYSIEKIKELYRGQIVRIDHITELKEVSMNELSKLIYANKKNKFPYGLIINGNYILCEELTLFSIIDYENNSIDIENINKYFKTKNIITEMNFNKIIIFSTKSMLLNNIIIPLEFSEGFHVQNRCNHKLIADTLSKAATKLLNMTYSTGKFIYGINALTGEKYTNYNVLRHAGSIWALINTKDYIDDPEVESKIDKLIQYLIDEYLIEKRNKAFLYRNDKKDGFSIGSCGLMLLLLADYQIYFNNDKYMELAKKVANGIISMQQPNGHYFQLYDNNFELSDQFICEYYVGETTLGLIKMYSITKEQKYLDSVIDALDYYISINFEKYNDHWMAYTLAEITKYVQDEKIVKFAIKNVTEKQKNRFCPSRLEGNMQLYKFYHQIKLSNSFKELLEEFPIEQVESNINFYVKTLMSYFIGKETAIYTKKTKRSLYGFFCPTDSNRMRIDDIQHSIMGLKNYYECYEKE